MKRILNFIKKIVNNDYLFSVVAKVLGLFIAVVLSVLTARYFGTELKGISAIISNDISLYAVFLGLGVYQAYPFYRKTEPEIYTTYINHIFTYFCLLEAIAAIVAIIMFQMQWNIFLAVAILFMPVEAYIKQLNYVVLCEHPRRRNLSSLLISLSEIVLLVLLWIFFDASVATVITYTCAAYIFNLLLSFINLRANPFKLRFQFRRMWEFVKFGFVPMLVYLCMTINYKIDIQMLKWFDNVSYSDIGIYSVGVSLAAKIWLIPDAIKDILLSKLVKGKGEEEVAKVLRINLAICVAATVFLILLGKPLVNLLYGKEFEQVYYVMVLLLVGMLGMIFYKMVYSFNVAQGKRTINLVFLLIAAIVNVIGNFLLIPHFGMWGAAVMSIVSYNICGLCFLIYFKKVSKIPYFKLLFVQKQDLLDIKTFLQKN